ncbi:MAG: HAD family hydrolase [Selenomonadaceae bacterium]|nr:HAD family hydrolase [Selenomonadaceae bacterium]
MTKAIFFDIDGTLLDGNAGIFNLTERVKTALNRLKNAGHYIFIATGRPYAFLQREILNFGFDGYVLLNGAVVIVDGKIIFRSPIDKSAVKKICEYVESEQIEYILESHPQIYFRRDAKAIEDFFRKIRVDCSNFIRDFEIDDVETFKVECVTFRRDVENLDKIYKKILETPNFTGWSDPFRFKSLEVSSNKISKADGIFKILNHFNIDIDNSYAFGDGFNDIEMISRVGTGFAMGTAGENLKQKAKFVVPSVHEDGVAVGIEKYILSLSDKG